MPEINFSEITHIYIAHQKAAGFTDVTSTAEWAARLSNDDDPPPGSSVPAINLIRTLKVIGELAAPTETTKEISGKRSIPVRVDRTLDFVLDDTNEVNYSFIRKSELRNGLRVKAWFFTAGSLLYGGNSGIPGYIKIHPVWTKGKDEIEIYAGSLTWNYFLAPDRTRVAGNSLLIDYDDAVIIDSDGSGILTGLDGTNKKITELPGISTLDPGSLIIIGDPVTGALSKMAFDTFKSLFPSGSDITKFVFNEMPSGVINGNGTTGNKVFNALNIPVTGTLRVQLNGIYQVPGIDYVHSTGTTTYTFTKAPYVGDQIREHYIKQ